MYSIDIFIMGYKCKINNFCIRIWTTSYLNSENLRILKQAKLSSLAQIILREKKRVEFSRNEVSIEMCAYCSWKVVKNSTVPLALLLQQ